MSMMWQKLLASTAAAGNTVTVTYVGGTNVSGTTSTHTFTNHAIGTADANRLVVVVAYPNGSSPTGISGITLGGNAMALDAVVSPIIPTGPFVIASRAVSSGTTATIVVSTTGNASRCRIEVYSLVGSAAIPTLKDSDQTSGTGTSLNRTIDASAGNGVVAGFGMEDSGSSGDAITWTNLTEDSEDSTGSTFRNMSVAHAEITSGSSLTVTATSAGSNDLGLAVVCYE